MGEKSRKDLIALHIIAENRPGVLRDITQVIASKGGNITYLQSFIVERGVNEGKSSIYAEIENIKAEDVLNDIRDLPVVYNAEEVPPFIDVYGKRVIIIGAGAQVAQVAMGAISEADRHNIRGERISVDTIPLVGEETIGTAVNAVSRLHRASILVLAGSLMGGSISKEVDRLRSLGIPVISLNMAGSVPEHADLVVTDPVQAGTFAVMHIAETASFDISKLKKRRF
jgi:energy-converting hydrogenase B subunit Q